MNHINPKVGIVLINWNSGVKTIHCIESIQKPESFQYEIIVIDNGSKDGSLEKLKARFPDLRIFENKANMGFVGACNQGLKYFLEKQTPYCILFNNDMIADENWLRSFVAAADRYETSDILGSTIAFKNMPRLYNSTGVVMNFSGYCWDRDFGEYVDNVKRQTGEVLAVSGGSMLIKTRILSRVGYLDKDYFAYYEDLEFCLRYRRILNGNITFVSEAKCFHEYSGSSSSVPVFRYWLTVRNFWINIAKTFSLSMIWRYYPRILWDRLRGEIRNRIRNKQYKFLCIEIVSIVLFFYYLAKNVKMFFAKDYSKNYEHLLVQSQGYAEINISHIEKESKQKWKSY